MAENKVNTLEQLKMLALREKAYSAAHIAELADLVAAFLEDSQFVGITITLPAINWVNGTQVIKHEFFLADANYWYFVCGDVGVKAEDITINGQAIFHHEAPPSIDLTVDILRLEVET